MPEHTVAIQDPGTSARAAVSSAGSLLVTQGPADNETVTQYGTASAPTANTAVATLASGSLPAGLYDFDVYATFTGTTVVATETDNVEFREGATVVGKLPIICIGTTGNTAYSGPFRFRRRLDGSTAVSINATANATASSVYRAEIIAVKVAP